MIIDRYANYWRVTFASEKGVTPRVEVFHQDRKPAMKIAMALERLALKKFPKHFPAKDKSWGEHASDGVLAAFAIAIVGSQMVTGAAAIAAM